MQAMLRARMPQWLLSELGEQRLAGMGIEFTPAHLGWRRGVGAPETGKTGTGDNVDQAR